MMTYLPDLIPYIQLILATVLGMVLGIERVMAGRTAGPRTYGLVSMGACLLTMLSIATLEAFPALAINGDPYHVIASIITGVGFIGAGLIVFRGSHLSGLTTAAGIWVSAAIGIAVGYKFYFLATFATFLVLFMFTIMWRWERKFKNMLQVDPDTQE